MPASGACWIEVAGAYAMFDGVESPLTQTFGLGVFEEVTATHLDLIEAFFEKHQAPVFHEISPMADPQLITLLSERGYRPIELTNVLFQEIAEPSPAINRAVSTRVIDSGEEELWAKTSAAGWSSEMEELGEFMFNLGKISAAAKGCYPFVGEIDGTPIATGSLFVYDETAILAGASTVPEGRRKGAQSALLNARLAFAHEKGCKIAMMGTAPGSQSQRNAEKNGFRVAYTRTKWMLVQ
jgi:GNAT superfamily N-acetyltransferase